ncbi:MAG: hypothetical protein KDE53_27830, partial [Caldilineaceae bacterium]|nr:hypothetical protein [Caldilineaceae bacterium]
MATEAGVRIGFDVLPVAAIENMVGLAGNGSPLRDLLVDSYGVASDGMLNQLIRATALGKNPRVTARAMVREGLSQSLNRMMVTARTEQLRVYRESSRMAYQASGVVEKHRRLATRDSRTCPACLMLDGEEMELDQPLREHPQGRCTTIPVVTGLPTVEWEKGPDWFRRQPPDVQRSILGKGRYDAWAAGQFDLDQLVSVRQDSTWGDSVQPTPLRDLLGGSATPITIRRSAPATPIAPVVPIQRQPKGTPVANALQVPESGKYRAQYQAAIDAIAEVHGDGKLPEIPIKTKSDMDSFGYYAHYSDGTPQEIAIRGTGDHMELTLAHEIGHFLDHQGIAAPSHFASVDSDVMQEWRNAVMQSEAVKDLQAKLADPVSYEREIEYQGRRFIASPDPLYL